MQPEKRRWNKVKAKLWSTKVTWGTWLLSGEHWQTFLQIKKPILGIWDESMSLENSLDILKYSFIIQSSNQPLKISAEVISSAEV